MFWCEKKVRACVAVGAILTGVGSWCAVILAVAAWVLLSLADRHWVGTLLEFGPRWVMLAPVGMAGVFAAFWRPKSLFPLAVAGLIIAGPVMGLCLPVRTWLQGHSGKQRLRVLTCNTLVGNVDSRFVALIEQVQPDVIALQEWPTGKPVPEAIGEDWNVVRSEGLVLASRWPIVANQLVKSPLGGRRSLALRGELQLDCGPVEILVLHLMTPRKGLEAVLARGWYGLSALEDVTEMREIEAAALGKCLDTCKQPLILAGDFNMTTESSIYRNQFGRWQNAFSVSGWGWGGTKWTRHHGVRIDHVLADDHWRFDRCVVGPEVGSDHRPVIADLVYVRPSGLRVPVATSTSKH